MTSLVLPTTHSQVRLTPFFGRLSPNPLPLRSSAPQYWDSARLRSFVAVFGQRSSPDNRETHRAIHNGWLFSFAEPTPHPLPPSPHVFADADFTRTFLIIIRSTHRRMVLHGNTDKTVRREAIAEEVEARPMKVLWGCCWTFHAPTLAIVVARRFAAVPASSSIAFSIRRNNP